MRLLMLCAEPRQPVVEALVGGATAADSLSALQSDSAATCWSHSVARDAGLLNRQIFNNSCEGVK